MDGVLAQVTICTIQQSHINGKMYMAAGSEWEVSRSWSPNTHKAYGEPNQQNHTPESVAHAESTTRANSCTTFTVFLLLHGEGKVCSNPQCTAAVLPRMLSGEQAAPTPTPIPVNLRAGICESNPILFSIRSESSMRRLGNEAVCSFYEHGVYALAASLVETKIQA